MEIERDCCKVINGIPTTSRGNVTGYRGILVVLAVQAGFHSDVVECKTLDRRVTGSIPGWGMEILCESP